MLGPQRSKFEHRSRNEHAACQRHGPDDRRAAAGALGRCNLCLRLGDLGKGEPSAQGEPRGLPGGANAEARDLEQIGTERFLQLSRRPVHGGPGAPGAPRRPRKGALLHHGDERMELRRRYAPQDIRGRRISGPGPHRDQGVAQHLERPLDPLRGRAPLPREREPGIAALHETRPEGGLDLPDRLSHRRLTEVRHARRRAHTAAPDYLIEQHEMPQVRCRVRAVRGIDPHVHNFLYPAVNCNYPTRRRRPENCLSSRSGVPP